MLMFTGGDIFGKKYTLATEKKSQAGKTWFELVAKPAGRCTEPEFVNAEHMYNMFSGMSIVAEEEHPESHTQETESKEY
jgi:hypothetical protein